ncbi:SRPBCC family protein [Conexibacter sp. JD483]|uniref:SRPBCC family protein n=1 Tax=unclassified Conexibacter TaxID=2627773 RepID=UPI00271A40BA|nr:MULTISPECIES: SRPBCC family protein [unclassified Conexibacter]MDO8188956.1 SRPBCC family protein [Conexibacter sp. CPCC 205706]MDO8201764.1 SRPBCC family protein [Conexibacter sp. CPCC 205762]MDR9371429.1 SRPBCC family protein [Conexibacter sp. JD483]
MEVRAARPIAAAPEAIFAFLANPDRHWQLLGRRLEPLRAYDGERSQVRLHGPLGIRRTLWIRLAAERPPHELVGRVEAGRGATIGSVRWTVRPATDGSSVVELTARTELAAPLDRLLLAAGGARWLRQSLERALAALDLTLTRGGRGDSACLAEQAQPGARDRRAEGP